MRIIFLPGYGEKESIFDKIYPSIPGEKVFVDHWTFLGDQLRPELSARQYARQLVEQFSISRKDVLIGHSMGGWVALHIKELVGCPIIQISSWTDRKKVVVPRVNKGVIFWLAERGLVYNRLINRLVVWKGYRKRPSREVLRSVLENLRKGNNHTVANQLRVIFNPVNESEKVGPELRIHARADKIVRYPDEATYEVPGDHFTLWTAPEMVIKPIVDFLNGEMTSVSSLKK